MAGQIIKRGKRRYTVRVFDGYNEDGKRRYLNKQIHGTRKDARYLPPEAGNSRLGWGSVS